MRSTHIFVSSKLNSHKTHSMCIFYPPPTRSFCSQLSLNYRFLRAFNRLLITESDYRLQIINDRFLITYKTLNKEYKILIIEIRTLITEYILRFYEHRILIPKLSNQIFEMQMLISDNRVLITENACWFLITKFWLWNTNISNCKVLITENECWFLITEFWL